jgi:hypothetical protein
VQPKKYVPAVRPSPSTSSLHEVFVAAAAGVRAGFQVAVHDVPARLTPDVHKSRENKPERHEPNSFSVFLLQIETR